MGETVVTIVHEFGGVDGVEAQTLLNTAGQPSRVISFSDGELSTKDTVESSS